MNLVTRIAAARRVKHAGNLLDGVGRLACAHRRATTDQRTAFGTRPHGGLATDESVYRLPRETDHRSGKPSLSPRQHCFFPSGAKRVLRSGAA